MGEVLVSGSVGHLFGVEGWCFKHIAEAVGWIQFYSAVNDVSCQMFKKKVTPQIRGMIQMELLFFKRVAQPPTSFFL